MELDELNFGTFNGGKLYLYDQNKVVHAKECGRCAKVRDINLFGTGNRIGNKHAWCLECDAEEKRLRYASDPEHVNEINKRWRDNNPEKVKLIRQRTSANRKARLASLPDTLTAGDISTMFDYFEGVCALTGDSTKLHIDHAIPIAIGHGGSIVENMIPLRGDINISKKHRNIFDWFRRNKKRYNLSQERFDFTIAYLAKLNGMSPAEYRDYVSWCHANPCEVADAM